MNQFNTEWSVEMDLLWHILRHDFIESEKIPSKLQYKKIIIFDFFVHFE